jgi:hypothetical protein
VSKPPNEANLGDWEVVLPIAAAVILAWGVLWLMI